MASGVFGRTLPNGLTIIFLIVAAHLAATSARATTSGYTPDADICDAAAQQVAGESGVPIRVLMAITRNETGRQREGELQPWPWTVNMEGTGKWFTSQDEARAYVFRHFKRGARSFDVGCFQINYRWHGKAFRSIDEMFDPLANARYAARFLNELFAEFGNWSDAAGAYHSRTPTYAKRYKARFDRLRASLDTSPAKAAMPRAAPQTQAPRVNNYPLMQSGSGVSTGRGSLFPTNAAGAASLFGPAG